MIKIQSSHLSSYFHKHLAEKDIRELYSTNLHDYYAINYRRRINKIIRAVIEKNPRRVLEVGCAQGNISLQLAEKNIFTIATDINLQMLTYSKMKYEKGPIAWIVTNGETPAFKSEAFDCIILAEILEHCADPLDILCKTFELLQDNGIVVITTPNGESKRNTLPSYFDAVKQYTLMTTLQFGPDGENHLFAFRWRELCSFINRAGFTIEKMETFGHHFMHFRCLYHLRHIFPWIWNVALENIITRIPQLRFNFTDGFFVVARKR